MKSSFIIGRVATTKQGSPRIYIDQANNRAAVTIYCGTQYNSDQNAPKVHLTVTAWYNYATDKVKNLKANDVVMINGTLKNQKNKQGVYELSVQADDNNITILDEVSQAGWGVYTNFVEMGYISGVFLTSKGYNVNIRTRYYTPYFKKNGEHYERVTAYDERQLTYQVGPKSRAFKAINAFLGKLLGTNVGTEQASKEQLESLKNFFVVIEDGFTQFSDKPVTVEGKEQKSIFANSFAQNILFIFKHQKANSNSQSTTQSAQQGNIPPGPPPEAYNDDVPFGFSEDQDFEQEVGFP